MERQGAVVARGTEGWLTGSVMAPTPVAPVAGVAAVPPAPPRLASALRKVALTGGT